MNEYFGQTNMIFVLWCNEKSEIRRHKYNQENMIAAP